jgi:hypothetical protein
MSVRNSTCRKPVDTSGKRLASARVKLNLTKTLPVAGTPLRLKISAKDASRLDGKRLHNYGGYPAFRVKGEIQVDGYQAPARAEVVVHRWLVGAKPDEYVDHKNGDKYDCRRGNLRICTHAENLRNRDKSRNNTSGYKGVVINRKGTSSESYSVTASKDRKIYPFGTYSHIEVAARVYDREVLKLHGEFARLNFEEDRATAAQYVAPKGTEKIPRKAKSGFTGVYQFPGSTTYYFQARTLDGNRNTTIASGFPTAARASIARTKYLKNLGGQTS